MDNAGNASDCQQPEERRKVSRERRAAALVVHEAQGCIPLGEAKDGLDHVGPVLAAQPGRPHDRRRREVRERCLLAGELRATVGAERIGHVLFGVRHS